MEKKLTPLEVTRLDYPQTGELVKQHLSDLKNPANGIIFTEGTPLIDFGNKLEASLTAFETYLKNAQKSEFSEPLLSADKERETALRAINRYMKVLQVSDDADEKEAFRQLNIVWQVHKDLAKEADANQTIGIDNLLMDMNAKNLQPYVQASGISRYLDRVKTPNDTYKDILKNRNSEYADRILREGVRLKKELMDIYKQYSLFVVSMANLYPNDAQWDKILSLLNVSRKKFAELVARKKTENNTE